jgi:hypothetical protein
MAATPSATTGRPPAAILRAPRRRLQLALHEPTAPPAPDQPVYALQARALSEPDVLPTSVDKMAADHVERIRTVRPEGPYHRERPPAVPDTRTDHRSLSDRQPRHTKTRAPLRHSPRVPTRGMTWPDGISGRGRATHRGVTEPCGQGGSFMSVRPSERRGEGRTPITASRFPGSSRLPGRAKCRLSSSSRAAFPRTSARTSPRPAARPRWRA